MQNDPFLRGALEIRYTVRPTCLRSETMTDIIHFLQFAAPFAAVSMAEVTLCLAVGSSDVADFRSSPGMRAFIAEQLLAWYKEQDTANVGLTIECEEPDSFPHREDLERRGVAIVPLPDESDDLTGLLQQIVSLYGKSRALAIAAETIERIPEDPDVKTTG